MIHIPNSAVTRAHIDRNGNISLEMREAERFRVLFDFDAVEAGELSVKVGDIVEVTDHTAAQDGWVLATTADGARKGFLPEDYVELIAAGDGGGSASASVADAASPLPEAQPSTTAAEFATIPVPASPTAELPSSPVSSPPWRASAQSAARPSPTQSPTLAAPATTAATATSTSAASATTSTLSSIYRADDSRLEAHLAEMIAPARLPGDGAAAAGVAAGTSQLTRVLDAGITSNVDFEALLAAHDEWRDRVHEERRHAFDSLQSSLSAVSSRMAAMQTKDAQTASKLEQLDGSLQHERARWIARVEELQQEQK